MMELALDLEVKTGRRIPSRESRGRRWITDLAAEFQPQSLSSRAATLSLTIRKCHDLFEDDVNVWRLPTMGRRKFILVYGTGTRLPGLAARPVNVSPLAEEYFQRVVSQGLLDQANCFQAALSLQSPSVHSDCVNVLSAGPPGGCFLRVFGSLV